ncbi:MAG: thiol reductant ABC exporter subunit CydD [Acetobacteraceae bacterium]|nr:thiol reductant ABC exporter subunit CydD [Acetobacteraceae bacterium]
MPNAVRKKLESFLRKRSGLVRGSLAASVACGAVAGLTLIAQAWLTARTVGAVVFGGQTLDAVWPWLWALLAVIVLRTAVTAIGDAVAVEAGARVVLAVRAALQERVVTLGPSWTRRQRTGDVATTVVDAADNIGRYYAGYLPQRVLVAFIPLAILAFVVPTDWVSAIILTVSAPLIPLFMVLIGRGTEALNQAQWRKLALLAAHLFDAIEGLTTLKLFGASRAELDAISRSSEAYRVSTMEVLRVAFLSSLALEFLATIGIAMVAVYVGFRLYYRELDFLPGFAVLLLAPEFYRPLRAMGTQYHARMEAIGAADAIVALLDTPAPPVPERHGSLRAGPVQQIRFERVSFSYGTAPTLDGIDLTLARGRRVALVGPSGAGKTTISQLLLGFLAPSRGRITVDGIDLATLAPDEWRARIGWLPQRPTLFHGSVRDNICLGQPHPDPARVQAAVEQAGATQLIARLPQGLDTVLGDRGQGLSGGEIQRIALARVFLAAADLVVFDEPGAALDRETADIVARSIDALSPRCATLIIAHRLETVRHADEIVVLSEGRVVERGSHYELCASGTMYGSVMGLDRARVDA